MQDVLAFRWSTRDRDLIFQGRELKDWTFEKLAAPALSRMAGYMSRLEELSLSNEPENSSLQGTETAITTEESEDSASHEAERSQELDVAGEPAEHNSIDERAEQIQGWLSSKGIPIPSQVVMEHVVSSMRIRSKPFRRLLITSSGYIGNVHPQAQKGDWICMIQGCKMPVVLRRMPTCLHVVGDAWIPGYTEGCADHENCMKHLHEGAGSTICIG